MADHSSSSIYVCTTDFSEPDSHAVYSVPHVSTLLKNLERTYKIHKALPKELLLDVSEDQLKELIEALIKAKYEQKAKYKSRVLETPKPSLTAV